MNRFAYALCAIILLFSACEKFREDPVVERDPNIFGIIGDWYSTGENVGIYVNTVYGVDSIFSSFYADSTYRIERFRGNSASIFEGDFSQRRSEIDSIWSITLKERKPNEITLKGIFKITSITKTYELKYEVIQVNPSIGLKAPTPEGGFGSTSLQKRNIQTYIQMEYNDDAL